jgi:hypothetical protein
VENKSCWFHKLSNKENFSQIHHLLLQQNICLDKMLHVSNPDRQYSCLLSTRLGAHWQVKRCGDKTVAVNVRALKRNSYLCWQLFSFSTYGLHRDREHVYALFCFRIRKDRRKKATLGTSSSQLNLLNFYKTFM